MYGFHAHPKGTFNEVIEAATKALKAEGFGVLSDIDVAATFKARLDIERRPYRILGACNPALAFEAFGQELNIGTLLPCNVIVYAADDGSTAVMIMDPEAALSLIGNPQVYGLAARVKEKLERVLAQL